MNHSKGFGLIGVIVIMIATALVTSIATGVIMLNASSAPYKIVSKNLKNDKDLEEFIEIYDTLVSKYYDENINKKGMLNAAENAMINYLGDKYTTYLNDEEYNDILEELSGTYYGIGILIKDNVIVSVTKESPAEEAGLMTGDVITKINDVDIKTLVENEESKVIIANEIKLLIKDNTKDEVTLEVERDNKCLSFVVSKEDLVNPTIGYEVLDNTKIGYIYIKNFSINLKDQIEEGLQELEKEGIESLIIDVRDDAGGYLSAAEEVASIFLEEGKVIYSLETSSNKYTYKDETSEKKDYKIAVLINSGSASASEILAAALKESYGAILVGTTSYGKGKVQQVVALSNGDSVKYTSAKWLTPKGVCIDGIGLTPDYTIPYEKGITYDSQIEKAIEMLS